MIAAPGRRENACIFLILLLLIPFAVPANASNGCINCHVDKAKGQQHVHSIDCAICHAGNSQSNTQEMAHEGLIAFPGNLSNAEQTCGKCHARHVHSVNNHPMSTARGMIRTTRTVLGESDSGEDITHIGHSIPDSLLRKLCSGCHLGRDKKTHTHDALNPGGGCLACHLDEYPATGHIQLNTTISDARCFGCHSRSGRVSMSYAGLAEIDAQGALPDQSVARLFDGRLVEIKESDVHHQAGMSCIDCHTGNGLMGIRENDSRVHSGIDIQCQDCHQPEIDQGQKVMTRNLGTELSHVLQTAQGTQIILKASGWTLNVPLYNAKHEGHDKHHSRIDCNACHTQWAPMCYGCHVRYDENQNQYDYVDNILSPGKWIEQRWHIQTDQPVLGVTSDNRISTFVPGMIMTLEHPGLDAPLFRRLFAPLSVHTTGKARSCQSCHCNSQALGLGKGTLIHETDGWTFTSSSAAIVDGIAEDAWQDWDHLGVGQSTQKGARPLNAEEIQRVLNSGVECQL